MILKEVIRKKIKECLTEQIKSLDDFHELISETYYNIFYSIRDKEKISFELIKPTQYKRALEEYMQYGKFVRFPEDKIFDWKELVLTNIVLLFCLTDIHGHGNFPFHEFHYVFEDEDISNVDQYNFSHIYDILYEKYNIDDYTPQFSNGQPVLSDFGLQPLGNLAVQLIPQTKPEDIIITINKIMNVAHQRSDLSELFIEGGEKSHSMISNS